jgi:single-strand DNA-binding protein
MNLLIISGHLVANPVAKPISDTRSVVNGTIANNLVFQHNGEKREEVVFHDFEAYGRIAEVLVDYVTTKRKVLLEGRVKQDRWEKDGKKFSRNVLVVSRMEFMSSAENNEDSVAHVAAGAMLEEPPF